MGKTIKRFAAGKLVMFSNKKIHKINTINGFLANSTVASRFPYMVILPRFGQYEHLEKYICNIDPAVPFLLLEDPKKIIPDNEEKLFVHVHLHRNIKFSIWRIIFLYNNQIICSYLTNKQYSQALVKAVPRRMPQNIYKSI